MKTGKKSWAKEKFLLKILILCVVGMLVGGCLSEVSPTRLPQAETGKPLPTATNSPTPTPTKTPEPTATQVPTPTPEPTIAPFAPGSLTLLTEDGIVLAGYITLPEAEVDKHVALILAHERDSNYHAWDELVSDFVQMGYTVLAFDFRGHGESSGTADYKTLLEDVSAAIDYLEFYGFAQIVCVGSSQGGTGCLAASLKYETIIGLALISAPQNIQRKLVTKSDLEALEIPKLVMVAENDYAEFSTPGFVKNILQMYEFSAEPKLLWLEQGISHGTMMLLGDPGLEARTFFFDFLDDFVTE
jgi:pimeloyl-ACP methyl ester carboxylesterase